MGKSLVFDVLVVVFLFLKFWLLSPWLDLLEISSFSLLLLLFLLITPFS